MRAKPVVLRERARLDIEESADFYLDEGGESVALRFIDALEHAVGHIARHPGTGSPRYAHALNLEGLRCWQLTRFAHLVFYVEHDDHIDVWRVLSERRDIPAWIQEPPGQTGPARGS